MIETLTPQQIQAALMLAEGRRTSDITYDLKISESTLYRWKKKRDFKELINNMMRDELAETRFRLAHLADASVSALWDLVARSSNDYTRLQAAIHVLKLSGIMHLPSPNVTQTVQYVLKPEEPEEAEKTIVTNGQGGSRVEDAPLQ